MPTACELLNTYGLSKARGFLPDETPLDSFQNSYYAPWDKLNQNLPQLVSSKSLRQEIETLPLLTTEKLASETDLRRAYVVLSFLVHALVWGSNDDGRAVEHIPPQITEPYFRVCESLGMHPVLSYAGLCLWNWKPEGSEQNKTDGFFDLTQLISVASFMNSRGEDTFYHVPVLVEAEGGELVYTLLRALDEAESGDSNTVKNTLQHTTKVLEKMTKHLPKLYTSLDADMFYFQLRPYLAGGKGMTEKGLPRGFVFERSDGSEVESHDIGGSAAQSSLFQFLDIALGVKHEGPKNGGESLFEEMRAYMPRQHREFLKDVSQRPSLRSFVESRKSDSELCDAYEAALKQLRTWRATHIAVVSKYVVRPARQEVTRNAERSEDFESSDGSDLQGTAGSALIPFLKQTKDETKGLK